MSRAPAHAARAACLLVAVMLLSTWSLAQREPVVRQIEIDLVDYRFKPPVIEIEAGKPVELILRNRDSITPHDLTLEAPQAGLAVKADVGPGETVKVMLHPTAPGEFVFFCSKKLLFFASHRERGMEGTLKVTAP
jgi:plastocyanin